MHPRDSRHCYRCGAVLAEDRATVPYVGPGLRIVELRDVRVERCTRCTKITIALPDPSALDTLIQRLDYEMDDPPPQLAYEQGCWSLSPRRTTGDRTK